MKKVKKNTALRYEVRQHFGSYNDLAKKLMISRQAVYNWSQRGIPLNAAFAIYNLTKGKYTVEELMENW